MDVHFSIYSMIGLLSLLDNTFQICKLLGVSNILFLKFEDMKNDLHQAIETISSFLGYKLEPQVVNSIAEQCTFQSMKENPSTNYSSLAHRRKENSEPFLRKGIVGDWKSYFTEDQNRRFDEEYAKRMSGSGLDFEFELGV